VIDSILGEDCTARVRALRAEKPELGAQTQEYYDALFRSSSDSGAAFSLVERRLVAIRTGSHTQSNRVTDWYAARADAVGVSSQEIQMVMDIHTSWPDDHPLSAAMRHVALVTTRPVESSRSDIDALLESGLSPQG